MYPSGLRRKRKYLKRKVFLEKNDKGINKALDGRIKDVDTFLDHFYWNDIYAQTQIISLFYGNLSFYKNTQDFYKRGKEIWAPGDYLDTTNINEKYFITTTQDVEVTDEDVISEIEKITNSEIANSYRNSSETDGQAIIDIHRWREIQIGKGQNIELTDSIYQRVLDGVETEN